MSLHLFDFGCWCNLLVLTNKLHQQQILKLKLKWLFPFFELKTCILVAKLEDMNKSKMIQIIMHAHNIILNDLLIIAIFSR